MNPKKTQGFLAILGTNGQRPQEKLKTDCEIDALHGAILMENVVTLKIYK